ncbi:MAG: hypothetical protein E7435_03560 [Ruminococcaceae bacterium]|nr:hypothetical protein [Oscillospiraceae bacterium]
MLYVTTRSNCETYTAAKTLTANTAADGGMFVPFQIPSLPTDTLRGMSQEAVISAVLGLFFRNAPSEQTVLACLGGTPFRLQNIDRKITVVQLWNNRIRAFDKIEYALYGKLCLEVPACAKTTQWAKIAIRISVMVALLANEDREVDIAVNAGDFLTPMAAFYCKEMGLPVGKILCVTNENSSLWEFFTHGELSCGSAVLPTNMPELDVVLPHQLERLIFAVSGLFAAKEFALCAEKGKAYKYEDIYELSQDFAVSVVSTQRVPSVIHRIQRSNGYVLDTYSALTFGGLQDYRATGGEIRQTLILSDYSPVVHRGAVSSALGVPEFKLSDLI